MDLNLTTIREQHNIIITSESYSESGFWGNSDCFSMPEKSGGSGLLASFHGWVCRGEFSI